MLGICAIWGKRRLPTKSLKKVEQSQKSNHKSYRQHRIQSLLIYHDPLVPTFITADGFNHFLVRRHDDRLEEILPRVVGL
jgi:hypothetical protein